MERLAGVPAEDVLGRHPSEVFPFLRETGILESLENAVAGGTPPAVVFCYGDPENPQSVWTSNVSGPLRNAKGEIIGVIATVREITEERRALNSLEQMTSLMRSVIDTSPDFIFVKDLNLRSIMCNEAYAKALGKRPEELVGKTDIENGWNPDLVLGDPSRGIRGFETDDRDALEGMTVHNPSDPANVGGEVKVFDTVKLPLRAADGSLIGVLGVARDITERKQAEDALRESEQRFDEIARQATEMIWETDAVGLYTYMSEVSEALTGYSPEELVGKKHFYDIHPREGRDAFKEGALAAFAQRVSFSGMENPIERKDGRIVWVSTNGMPILDSDGNLAGYRGSDTDITERKQADEALREANQFSQEIISSAQEGIVVYDRDLRYLVWSQFMEQLTGVPASDVLGRHPAEVFPFLRETGVIENLEKALAGEMTPAMDVPYSSSDTGRSGWTSQMSGPLRNAEGEIIGVINTVREITEQKTTQDALAREYHAAEAMSDLRHALLSSASLEDIASRVLNHGKDLTGSKYGYVGYVAPETNSLVYAALSADNCRSAAAKSISAIPPGLRGWVLENKKPLLSNSPEHDERWGGTPKGHVPITRFISAPALLGDELVGQVALANPERDYDENDLSVVERLAAFFALAIQHSRSEEALAKHEADLTRSNADLQQFAYVASHDLQEPLRMVSSYIQLLAQRYQGKLDKDADEFIEFAVDGSRRMQGLINGLLDFSRIDTRGRPFEPVDCEVVVSAALKNLQVTTDESGAIITHDALPTVMADDIQLTQVFQNLIGNAIKYCKESPPRVHISAERVGNEWEFSISDNGIGIAAEHFDRIFQIFQRLHARNEYPGTGIGLATSKRIVEHHGGRIWVESEVGKGSVFHFTIPASRTAATMDRVLTETPQPSAV